MDDDSAIDDDGCRDEGDSGPFCMHWSDPCDCDALCKCGHECCQHSRGEYCRVDGCECESFEDAP